MDVMFYEVFEEEKKALKLFLPTKIKAGFTEKAIQEYDSEHLPSTLISIRTQSLIPKDWAGRIGGILTRSTGYDHITAYREQTKAGFFAGYLPRYCARAVAEQAILMAMALLRKLKVQIENFATFNRSGITGTECFDKNLLVVGVGRIGSEVVKIAQGLKMKVKGVDIKPKLSDLGYTSLTEGIPWADIIICAAPLSDKTERMLDYEALKNAKPGVVLVNIARGEITPIEEMKELFADGILGGLGLDVFEEEGRLARCLREGKTPSDNKITVVRQLNKKENVLFTPHNAFNSQEALERKAEQSVESVVLFLEKKTFPYPVPEE